MIDTKFLEQHIQAPAARQLDTDDPAINDILVLAEHNKIIAAAEKAQVLWAEGVFDVRTLGCYLGGAFMERGLSALPLIFDCALKALTLNWEYLGPTTRKQRLCDVSLRWLFTTLLTQIDFHQHAKGEQWQRWNEGWTEVSYKEAAERCVQLAVLLDDVIPGSRCRGPLLNLKTSLDGTVRPSNETAGWKAKMLNATQVPFPPPPPEPETDSVSASAGSSHSGGSSASSENSSASAGSSTSSSSSSPSSSSGGDSTSSSPSSSSADSHPSPSSTSADRWKLDAADEPSKSSKSSPSAKSADESSHSAKSSPGPSAAPADANRPPMGTARPPIPPPVPTGESMVLPLSPALRVLMRQLDGFIQVLQKGELKKAVILYRQIQPSLAQFDPRFYLPSLFGPFYAQLAQQGQRLTARLKDPEDLVTSALVDLCRVDLELFLSTKVEE